MTVKIEMVDKEAFQCGYIAFIGRPNVGKSTLLNSLLGEKLSITTPKPQTTRHRILGIKTTQQAQMIFVDTPGYHLGENSSINRYMNRVALSALHDVDVVVFVTQVLKWTEEDEALLKRIHTSTPVIAVINKCDLVKDKEKMLPYIAALNKRYPFDVIIPLSAKKGDGLAELENILMQKLPLGIPYFDQEQLTDKSMRFLVAERIREKLFLSLRDEIPYALTVEIESFQEEKGLLRIGAIIWVERDSQKGIIIGEKGERLKEVGVAARKSIITLTGKRIFLQLWVKVKAGWSNDERALQSLGYDEGT